MSDITDAIAMTNASKDNDFLNGNGILIILFFLIFGGAWGGWGNNAATQGALTRAEVQDIVSSSSTQNMINTGFDTVNQNLCNGFANTALAMNNGFNGIQSSIADSRYAMADCCCQIKNAIHSEGEETRALIQSNTIQDLRDKVADKDRELQTTGLAAAILNQTNNLENFVRSYIGGCGCQG